MPYNYTKVLFIAALIGTYFLVTVHYCIAIVTNNSVQCKVHFRD